jgi:hypothetical protein
VCAASDSWGTHEWQRAVNYTMIAESIFQFGNPAQYRFQPALIFKGFLAPVDFSGAVFTFAHFQKIAKVSIYAIFTTAVKEFLHSCVFD